MSDIKNAALPRREARESAFLIVFEKIFDSELTFDKIAENNDISEFFRFDDFTKNLVNAVFNNIDEIDSIIENNLIDWDFSRISNIAKSLLRLGTAELKMYKTDIRIVCNEIVELAKKYSDQKDASFINGVLGSIARQVRD